MLTQEIDRIGKAHLPQVSGVLVVSLPTSRSPSRKKKMFMEPTKCAEFMPAQCDVDGEASGTPTLEQDASRGSAGKHGLLAFLALRLTVLRALKVSALVGTILLLINQGDSIIAGQAPVLWKLILTYVTPYAVSSYSTATLLRDQAD